MTHAAVASQALPAGAATQATEFRKVLLERDGAGAVSYVVGVAAPDQASAALPVGDPAKISVGWIEVPNSFVVGTTVVTGAMLKATPYTAG